MSEAKIALLLVGGLFAGVVALALITGKIVMGFRFVRRAEDPQWFWATITVNGVLAVYVWLWILAV